MISAPAKAALAADKVLGCCNDRIAKHAPRGVRASAVKRAGRAEERNSDLKLVIARIRTSCATSLGEIAERLNAEEIRTARRGVNWHANSVRHVLRYSDS